MLSLWSVAALPCDHQSCLRCGPGTRCALCNASLFYVPDGEGQCLVSYSQFCDLQEDDGTCHACSQNYIPYKGVCRAQATSDTCLRRDCDGKCVRCQNNNILSNGECAPDINSQLPDNCSFGNAQFACLECDDSYFLFRGKCYSGVSNCIAPSPCSSCAPNSFLVPQTGAQIRSDFWSNWVSLTLTGVFKVVRRGCVENGDLGCLEAISPTECGRCEDGYAINDQRKCVALPSELTCVALKEDNTCAACVEGYYLKDDACVKYQALDPNCVYYNSPILCERCKPHYYLISTAVRTDNVCIAVDNDNKDDKCDYYNTSGFCGYCISGFRISGGNCVPLNAIVKKCIAYTQQGCVLCGGENYLLNGDCEGISTENYVKYCARYNSTQECIECNTTHFLSDGECLPRRISGCAAYTQEGKCKYCEPSSYLDNDECKSIDEIQNCRIYDASGCVACIAGHDLVDGQCPNAAIDRCARFSSERQCEYCIENYFYDSTNNVCVDRLDANCSRQNRIATDTFECLRCEQDKVRDPSNNTCVDGDKTKMKIDGCLHYKSDYSCDLCQEGFSMNGAQTKCHRIKLISQLVPACLYYKELKCIECMATHYLDANDKCQPVVAYVSNCSDYIAGVCNHCADGFYLTEEAVSDERRRRLLQANHIEGRSLQTAETVQVCKPVTPLADCASYLSTGCEYCGSGKLLVDGACEDIKDVENCAAYIGASTCEACYFGYLVDNACTSSNLIAYCARYEKTSADATEVCVECLSSHYLVGGQCVPMNSVTNCKYYEDETHCAVCNNISALDENKLCVTQTLIQNCQEATVADGCYLCKTNFYYDEAEDACKDINPGIQNCLELLDALNCKRCKSTYYLSGGFCIQSIQTVEFCDIYAGEGKCNTCNDNYAVTNDGTKCIANCINADDDGNCLQCAANFTWRAPECVINTFSTIPGCLLFDNQDEPACVKCKPGFWLTDGACMDTVMENCTVVDPTNPTCAYCKAGFVLDGAGVCVAVTNTFEGCMFHNHKDPSQCDVCNLAYHDVQNHSQCVANGITAAGFETLIANWKTVQAA